MSRRGNIEHLEAKTNLDPSVRMLHGAGPVTGITKKGWLKYLVRMPGLTDINSLCPGKKRPGLA